MWIRALGLLFWFSFVFPVLLDRAQPDSAPLFRDTEFRAAARAATFEKRTFLTNKSFHWTAGGAVWDG